MTLPEPKFLDTDPAAIERAVIADFEGRIGQALTPNQPEWLLLQTVAYRESLVRIASNEAAKKNLLQFSEYPITDYLGALVGAERLEPQSATTLLRFSLAAPIGVDKPIPTGTRARSGDSVAVFASNKDALIEAGNTFVDVASTATATGPQANGYLAGQVNKMVDQIPGVTVQNLTTTQGGAPQESRERYIERIRLASDASSTAGGEESYKLHALSASNAVEEVRVLSPEPGQIRIVLLDDDGSVTPEIIELVTTKLSDKKVRPQGDQVSVEASGFDNLQIEAELTLYANADPETTLAAAEAAAEAYRLSRRHLGRSALREQIRTKLAVSGVHSLDLIEPAADVIPAEDSWARITDITITVVATSEEISDD